MCGLCGFIDPDSSNDEISCRRILEGMIDRMVHRGPDDRGFWVDPTVGMAMGHCRLRVLDLSPAGRQPMVSSSGRYLIAFNGEIYNYQSIRKEIEAAWEEREYSGRWRGTSDTEVMLEAIGEWGLERALKRFNGMFAFSLWDRRERTLYLARDRMGEKPLYYGTIGPLFLFGSELKSLAAHPLWRGEVDRNVLALYLRYGYIPSPYSIYKDFRKLPPGTFLVCSLRNAARPPVWTLVPYWSMEEVATRGLASPFRGSPEEAVDEIESLLLDSVKLRMAADVPVGAFLSGGIDSSTVVSLMQSLSHRPVKTFSIGFFDDAYNEAHYAKRVARHLHTDHTEWYVTPADVQNVVPRLPEMYDEPFADSSQIPTYLVSELAGRTVTVSLSGDGGDELFGGYNRYSVARNLWIRLRRLPHWVRRAGRGMLTRLARERPMQLLRLLCSALPGQFRHFCTEERFLKLADVMGTERAEEFYERIISHWDGPERLLAGSTEAPPSGWDGRISGVRFPDFVHEIMYRDTVVYLPDDILVKVDRAAMAVSLEPRLPLLDHRMVELAWRLPLELKIRNGRGKWPLRKVLYRYVPEKWVERPKKGFSIPLGVWLRGPLRDWAESLLEERKLKEQGFFRPGPVRAAWSEHLSGRRDRGACLWSLLMFQAWVDCYVDP